FLAARRRVTLGSGDGGVGPVLERLGGRHDLTRRLEEEYARALLGATMARVPLPVPAPTREAFPLAAPAGKSGVEVAARLGMQVATVFVARSKVQRLLRGEARKLEGPDEA